MDVTCERCDTEYELDDALVSSQGTTVKCTSCGHQFKVFRPEAGDSAPERWIVRKSTGRELVFSTLRELQRAIEQGRVGREDFLSRGSGPVRMLGELSELEPFFAGETIPTAPTQASAKTLMGMEPPAPPMPPPEPMRDELRKAPASIRESVSMDPTPSDFLGTYGTDAAPYSGLGYPRPKRSRALRYIVALVVLGMASVLGATVGRPYIEQAISKATPRPINDSRLSLLLDEGERALSKGDLESAKAALDKASVLGEDDPRLLEGAARLSLIRADMAWLKLRLLPREPAAVIEAAERALEDSVKRARAAVLRLEESAGKAPHVARAFIDVQRMAGDLSAARALVPEASSVSSQPETAYVLAMLDLAEPSPSFPTIVDRLRLAAAAEQELARARAVLVYALTRSGEMASAKSELSKILAAPHPHPLATELQAFVSRSEGAEGKETKPPVTTAKPAEKEAEAPKPAPEPKADDPGEPARRGLPTNHHELLTQASRAKAAGQLDRADELYRAALERHPGDTEALGGLGDIARARGNTTAARSYYEQAHKRNPSYLPVVAALADMRWSTGDREGARVLYRQIVDTAPGTTLAARASERLAQADKPADPPTHVAEPEEKAPTPREEAEPRAETPPSVAQPEPAPEIDTSDLPGFQR